MGEVTIGFSFHHFLDHIVMPKLTTMVNTWDPLRESMPIHAWLHLWIPLLGQHMEPLYPTICISWGMHFILGMQVMHVHMQFYHLQKMYLILLARNN